MFAGLIVRLFASVLFVCDCMGVRVFVFVCVFCVFVPSVLRLRVRFCVGWINALFVCVLFKIQDFKISRCVFICAFVYVFACFCVYVC